MSVNQVITGFLLTENSIARHFVPLSRAEQRIYYWTACMQLRLKLLGLLAILLLEGACSLPLYEKNSLISFYNATGGPYWTRNWSTATDPCALPWYGVTCDASNSSVTRLVLSSNNLTGSLPDLELSALSYL